jgi:hypothetical protein
MKTQTSGRQTIGADPLAALAPSLASAENGGSERYTKDTKAPTYEKDTKATKRARATIHVSEALLEEAKDAVVHLSGPPDRLTLAELMENALRREVERLRKKHNIEKFPRRGGELKGGRRIAD